MFVRFKQFTKITAGQRADKDFTHLEKLASTGMIVFQGLYITFVNYEQWQSILNVFTKKGSSLKAALTMIASSSLRSSNTHHRSHQVSTRITYEVEQCRSCSVRVDDYLRKMMCHTPFSCPIGPTFLILFYQSIHIYYQAHNA